MCGRYALHAHPDVVALQFNLSAAPDFKASYNIAPAAEVLVVKPEGAARAHWGLRGKLVNLRAETVGVKFSKVYRRGRCLVPASGFYEWKQEAGRKQPYYVFPRDEPLFGFAALWEDDTCTLITTDANAQLRAIHDRMPLILTKDEYRRWLDGEEGLLESAPQAAIVAHPVGMAVNQAAYDSPALIEPIELAPGLFD